MNIKSYIFAILPFLLVADPVVGSSMTKVFGGGSFQVAHCGLAIGANQIEVTGYDNYVVDQMKIHFHFSEDSGQAGNLILYRNDHPTQATICGESHQCQIGKSTTYSSTELLPGETNPQDDLLVFTGEDVPANGVYKLAITGEGCDADDRDVDVISWDLILTFVPDPNSSNRRRENEKRSLRGRSNGA